MIHPKQNGTWNLIYSRSTVAGGVSASHSEVTCSIWVRKMLARDKRGLVFGSGEALASSGCRLNCAGTNAVFLQDDDTSSVHIFDMPRTVSSLLSYVICSNWFKSNLLGFSWWNLPALRRPSEKKSFYRKLKGQRSYWNSLSVQYLLEVVMRREGPHHMLGLYRKYFSLHSMHSWFPLEVLALVAH